MLPGLCDFETVAVTLSTVLLLKWLLGLQDEDWTPRRGFMVLTMGNMKTLVFWVVILCIVHLVPLFQRNMLVSSEWKEGAGTRFLQNVGMLSDCKVLHSRRHNCCLEDSQQISLECQYILLCTRLHCGICQKCNFFYSKGRVSRFIQNIGMLHPYILPLYPGRQKC